MEHVVTAVDYRPVGDPAIPGLTAACSADAMSSVFDTEVLPLLRPAERVDRVEIKSVYYTPGRTAVVLYEVHISESAGTPFLALGSFGKGSANTGSAGSGSPDTRDEATSKRISPGSVRLPELGGVVEVFPFDSQLRSLRWAVDGAELNREFIASRLGEHVPDVFEAPFVTEVLRYRPHRRCTLRYRSQVKSGGVRKDVIGKVYRSTKRARTAWNTQVALHARSPDAGVRFPEPLLLVENKGFVVMESVPGPSVSDLLVAGSVRLADDLIERSAHVLRRLHRVAVVSSRPSSLSGSLADLRMQIATIGPLAPSFATQAESVVAMISDAMASCGEGDQALVHGDYTPSQLIDGANDLTVVDFDRFGVGDPAFDVGTFMAKLVEDAVLWHRKHLRPLALDFLEAYGESDGSFCRRVRVMQSIELARTGTKLRRDYRSDSGSTNLMDSSSQLLEEAASCLHQHF